MRTCNLLKGFPLIRLDIQTVVMGGLQMSSLVVLKGRSDAGQQVNLPIRIGPIEAVSITAGVEGNPIGRPLTHDLAGDIIEALGGKLATVEITEVHDTTFFARLKLVRPDGTLTDIDCRPSDAIALAVRNGVPIYAREQVLETATMPDFQQVEMEARKDELDAFHDFVENLNPEDFS